LRAEKWRSLQPEGRVMETASARICLRCGTLKWVEAPSNLKYLVYCKEVRRDGCVVMEDYCSVCGAPSLLGVWGSVEIFRKLDALKPAKRIIRILELIVEGKLEIMDDFTPEEVLGFIRNGYASRLEDEEALKRFLLEVEKIIARWKMIED